MRLELIGVEGKGKDYLGLGPRGYSAAIFACTIGLWATSAIRFDRIKCSISDARACCDGRKLCGPVSTAEGYGFKLS
jgi:hypothetical protein